MVPDNYTLADGVWIVCDLCQSFVVQGDERRFNAVVAEVLDHQERMHPR